MSSGGVALFGTIHNMNSLAQKLEAVLFYVAEPLERAKLAVLCSVTEEEVDDAMAALAQALTGHGIQVLHVNTTYELVTDPRTHEVIEALRKDEHTRELGKAGLETLAVVLYRGPISRAALEYVRGVNCAYVLRHLLIRGLVEKVPDPKNARVVLYQATPALYKHLGVTDKTALPNMAAVQTELARFEQERIGEHHDNTTTTTHAGEIA